MRIVGNDKAKEWGGHRKAFVSVETTMLTEGYLPPPKCVFAFEDPANARFPMRAVANLIAEAHRKRIDLRIAISPIHARLIEAMAAAGLWNNWEDWKRQVVGINETEAAKVGRPPYPLWDFSGYSGITTETVPGVNDADSRMKWYWESSHYKREAGDNVLDIMFSKMPSPRPDFVNDFGADLTGQMLETHLNHIREGRTRYLRAFPADVAEVKTAAHHARSRRQALGCKND